MARGKHGSAATVRRDVTTMALALEEANHRAEMLEQQLERKKEEHAKSRHTLMERLGEAQRHAEDGSSHRTELLKEELVTALEELERWKNHTQEIIRGHRQMVVNVSDYLRDQCGHSYAKALEVAGALLAADPETGTPPETEADKEKAARDMRLAMLMRGTNRPAHPSW